MMEDFDSYKGYPGIKSLSAKNRIIVVSEAVLRLLLMQDITVRQAIRAKDSFEDDQYFEVVEGIDIAVKQYNDLIKG